jgi:hypothetical protein
VTARLDPKRVAEFLLAQGIVPDHCSVTPLRGGYWNTVLKVAAPGGTYVLKHFVEVLPDSLFPNVPAAEAAALERLRGLGVAPDPIGFWPEQNILLYAFVEGRPWQHDVAAVARLLLRKERASPEGFRIVPWEPELILAEGDRLFARCHDDDWVSRFRASRPGATGLPPPPRLSLIHTDIGANNLIGAGDELRLIDWQCPAQGDLAEDVYSFLSPAFQILNEAPPLRRADTECFFDALGAPDTRARYDRLRPAFAYRMAGYCCVRYQGAAGTDDGLYRRYRSAIAAEYSHMLEPT